jgi:hypothetical protein
MHGETSAYGLWSLVIINSLVFINLCGQLLASPEQTGLALV